MKSRAKLKLGQVGVGSNIAQYHSSSLYEVIFGHYLPQFTWKVDQYDIRLSWVVFKDCSKSLAMFWSRIWSLLAQFTCKVDQNININGHIWLSLTIYIIKGHCVVKLSWQVDQKWNLEPKVQLTAIFFPFWPWKVQRSSSRSSYWGLYMTLYKLPIVTISLSEAIWSLLADKKKFNKIQDGRQIYKLFSLPSNVILCQNSPEQLVKK